MFRRLNRVSVKTLFRFVCGFGLICLVIGLTIILSGCGQSAHEIKVAAEAEARTWGQQRGQNPTISCVGTDSDQNGYVSCDVSVAGKDYRVECAYKAGVGCKTKSEER